MRLKAVDRLNLSVGGNNAGNLLADNFFRAHWRVHAAAIDAGEYQHRHHHQGHHHYHWPATVILALSRHAKKLTSIDQTSKYIQAGSAAQNPIVLRFRLT